MWWWQRAARKQLSVMLEYILETARARRWEYGRRSKGGGGREVVESDAGRDGPRYAGMDTFDAWAGE